MLKLSSDIVLLSGSGAKSYLTREELSNYQTLADLMNYCEEDATVWGLCQKESDFQFGCAGEGWVLQLSLEALVRRADGLYQKRGVPAYDPEDVYIVCGIEYDPKNPTANNCGCETYHLPKGQDIFHPRYLPEVVPERPH